VALVKGGIVFGLARWLTGSARVALLSAAALFQVGEFSFVVARQASQLGLLGGLDEQRFLAVAVLTMLVTPFAVRSSETLAARTSRRPAHPRTAPEHMEAAEVLIAGFGFTGRNLARVLHATGISHRVIELDPDQVRAARAQGVLAVPGDASRADGLVHAGLLTAKVLVVAVDDRAAARRAVALARDLAPSVQIVVRTRFLEDTEELMRLGASQVVPENFETTLAIFGRVLRELHVPRASIAIQTELIRREGYQALRMPVPEERHLEALREILASTAADTVFVASTSIASGRSIGELDVHRRTGATILSVVRNGEALSSPGGDLVFEPNDLVVALGDHEQLDRLRDLLAGTPGDWHES
jgi:CPA2 family monovalent cation:H+ antiporter-2